MNTPAHLIFGLMAFSKRQERDVSLAAVVGALVPDLSLYVLVGWSLYIAQIPPQTVFDVLYFSPSWQQIFAIDNSVFVWGGVLAVGFWRKSPVWIAFAGAALLHIAFDLPLHHDDGRAHFWPLTTWVYESPLSYWDRAQGATWIAPLETCVALIFCAFLLRRHPSLIARLGLCALAIAQLAPAIIWVFVFSR